MFAPYSRYFCALQPRIFEEIPPGELRAVGQFSAEALHLEPETDEHLRAILERFDLKRLTAQVSAALSEILSRPAAGAMSIPETVQTGNR
jgi:hypothetical protein